MATAGNSTAANASAPATGGQVQADPATNALIITAPEPQYRQLRSVIDKLEHKKGTTRTLRAKANELGEQLKKIEAQLDELTVEVAALEEKLSQFCESVGADPESDGDQGPDPLGEGEYPPTAARHRPTRGKGERKGGGKGGVEKSEGGSVGVRPAMPTE